MTEDIRFSEQGQPQWFSPEHAGEKFKRLCVALAKLASDVDQKNYRGLGKKLWELQEFAEEHAKAYLTECPVRSVRVMQPSGAIFAILADGREVLVPQPR